MPEWRYAAKGLDPDKTVRAMAREIDVSPKFSRELCRAVVGLKLDRAKNLMEDVMNKKKPIPYRRHRKERGHRRGAGGPGGFPVKIARHVLRLLESLEANAEFKGLAPSDIKITHAFVQKGRRIRRVIGRAHGRQTPYDKQLVIIQLIGQETAS